MGGYDGQTKLILVRNPSYNAATDSKAARENLPDEFDFLVDANADDILNKVADGEFQDEVSSIPSQTLRKKTLLECFLIRCVWIHRDDAGP